MRKKDDRIFPCRIKYVIVTPERLIPLTVKPKRIPGGYLTRAGRRYVRDPRISFNRVGLVSNSYKELYEER